MPESFVFNNPRVERVVFGQRALERLPDEILRLGGSRAFVVTSPSVALTPLLDSIRRHLGSWCVGVFERVRPHSPTDVIEHAAARARDSSADVLISAGGGSSIDTAKGVAALLAEGGPLPRFATRFTPPDRKEVPAMPAAKMPHLAIPTTLSGGEYSYSAGITEGGKKHILADPKLAPRTVLLDPSAAQTAPPHLLAASGMNALAHSVEAMYSTQTQPLTEALCLAAVGPIARYLPRAVKDPSDIEAVGQVQVAACLSALGVYSSWTGIHHAVVHVIGGRFQVPHANLHALVLPYAMRWNLEATMPAQARIAWAMGADHKSEEEAAAAAPDLVRNMNKTMGLPLRLRDLGIPRNSLTSLAEDALGDFSVYTNPKPIQSASQVLEVLEMAY